MNKIAEALKKILPAEYVGEVARAVEEMMSEHYAEVEAEAQTKLEQAYEQLTEEVKQSEVIAEAGYKQAYEIISSLMNRIDEQRQEFETALEEGFDEAFSELQKEKAKNGNIEVELYTEFDNKLKEMKSIMVDKLDQFMGLQEQEILETAKQHVLSDPRVLEQRIAVEKMAEILSDYISTDSIGGISSSKLEEVQKQVDALRGQVRLLESKNVRLSVHNNKLSEQVNEAHNIITEATKIERKERANRRGIASGRGQRVVNEQLISEYAAPTNNSNNGRHLTEGNDPLNDLLVLSGLEQS
jgi:regulator of replication initiation timing